MLNVLFPFKTTFLDYPDNESEAIIIFVMGCRLPCEGCQNPKFKDRHYDVGTKKMSPKDILIEIEKLSEKINSNKVVLTGGDPLDRLNVEDTKLLIKMGKKKFDFCIYTGQIVSNIQGKMIDGFKFLKTENFKKDKFQLPEKTDEYIRFASTNQRLYDENYKLISKDGIYYFNNK